MLHVWDDNRQTKSTPDTNYNKQCNVQISQLLFFVYYTVIIGEYFLNIFAEISCEVWSEAQRGRSLRRLHGDAAASIARQACVSPCALVLALLYLERLNACNPDYIASSSPADLFLVSLVWAQFFITILFNILILYLLLHIQQ